MLTVDYYFTVRTNLSDQLSRSKWRWTIEIYLFSNNFKELIPDKDNQPPPPLSSLAA